MKKIFALLIVLLILPFLSLSFNKRPLNEFEELLVQEYFGESVNYEKVRIKEGGPLTWIYPGVTVGYTISFPNGSYNFSDVKKQALFLHEMTHVWQYERIGFSYMFKALHEEIFEEAAYVIHYDEDLDFDDYDLEEQGEIVAEYFLSGDERYEKYIAELKNSKVK